MSDGSTPPTRESLYPEPHRAPGWDEPATGAPVGAVVVRKPQAGRWIAAAAGALVLAGTAWAGFAFGQSAGTAPVSTVASGVDTVNALQADVGLCLEDIGGDGAVGRANAVPCDTPHRAEVVASFTFTQASFPGAAAVESEMITFCGATIQPGQGAAAMFQPGDWGAGMRWVAWVPTATSWDASDRTGVCVVYRDADMVGSFVAGTVTFVN